MPCIVKYKSCYLHMSLSYLPICRDELPFHRSPRCLGLVTTYEPDTEWLGINLKCFFLFDGWLVINCTTYKHTHHLALIALHRD